jgi:hypothetical protein
MTTIIVYKNKEIIFNDHNGLQDEKLLESIAMGNKTAREFLMKKKPVIVISNFSNIIFTKKVLDYTISKEMTDSINIMDMAIICGVKNVHKLILKTFFQITGLQDKVKVFDTKQECLDYTDRS